LYIIAIIIITIIIINIINIIIIIIIINITIIIIIIIIVKIIIVIISNAFFFQPGLVEVAPRRGLHHRHPIHCPLRPLQASLPPAPLALLQVRT
jgi:amino acid transporter